jgi:tight adherence protein C
MQMLLLLAFVCLAGALVTVGQLVTKPARARQASLRRAEAYAQPVVVEHDSLLERLNDRYAGRLARFARRLDPRATEDRIGFKLVSAGLAKRVSPIGFLAAKVVLGAAGVVLGILLGAFVGSATWTLLLGVGGGTIGFFGPDVVIGSRTRKRRERMRHELPDALDVLAVSVEAGLGFDAALSRLGDYLEGPLVEEFLLVLAELRVGESRSNSLRKMAERVDIPELTAVVNSLIQAEQLGSPLGRMLRIQAQESRNRRQVAAEEKAMKAPVKMLVPTAIFIFPAMFVVILGPAMLRIFEVM